MLKVLDTLIVVGLVALCLVLVLGSAWLRGRLGGLVPAGLLPSYKRQALMTDNEAEFFGRLVAALPDCFVFAQVAMPALIAPSLPRTAKGYLPAFRRMSQLRVDYAVCDKDLRLLCVVELDDRTHDARKDAARDMMLRSAGIRTIRWQASRKPDAAAIAAAIREAPAAQVTPKVDMRLVK